MVPTILESQSLREKCPFSELFWSTFYRIRTECGKITPNRDNFYAVSEFEIIFNCGQRNRKYKKESESQKKQILLGRLVLNELRKYKIFSNVTSEIHI